MNKETAKTTLSNLTQQELMKRTVLTPNTFLPGRLRLCLYFCSFCCIGPMPRSKQLSTYEYNTFWGRFQDLTLYVKATLKPKFLNQYQTRCCEFSKLNNFTNHHDRLYNVKQKIRFKKYLTYYYKSSTIISFSLSRAYRKSISC